MSKATAVIVDELKWIIKDDCLCDSNRIASGSSQEQDIKNVAMLHFESVKSLV
jgi:hypothetical protein